MTALVLDSLESIFKFQKVSRVVTLRGHRCVVIRETELARSRIYRNGLHF